MVRVAKLKKYWKYHAGSKYRRNISQKNLNTFFASLEGREHISERDVHRATQLGYKGKKQRAWGTKVEKLAKGEQKLSSTDKDLLREFFGDLVQGKAAEADPHVKAQLGEAERMRTKEEGVTGEKSFTQMHTLDIGAAIRAGVIKPGPATQHRYQQLLKQGIPLGEIKRVARKRLLAEERERIEARRKGEEKEKKREKRLEEELKERFGE